MTTTILKNVNISGIACAVPESFIEAESYYDKFGKVNVDKFVKMTGVKKRHVALEEQTSSDLCYIAAEAVLEKLNWERDSIDAIIFVTQTPDYRLPATACVLHSRLKLSTNCLAFDVNLGCSGYVYGLYIASSLMQNKNLNRVLLLCGDTINKNISDDDKSSTMLFGDSGSVTALEYGEDATDINYLLKTDGSGYKAIITPSGAYRNRDGINERYEFEEGIIRSDFDLYLNGTEVFNFTISDVPNTINEFNSNFNLRVEDYDYCIMHQANLFMLKTIAKKTGFSMDKVPITIDRFGNTSVTSIPLTISDMCSNFDEEKDLSLMLSGFGVGLSWGVVSLRLNSKVCLPIIYTNDHYKEGRLLQND